jgi:deoxyribose-phosphate aldolase
MYSIVEICKLANITVKVIFENCYLTKEEKITLYKVANKYKPNFIKTSTGFGTSGATVEDITLMRYYALPEIQIKAAGGIKNLDTVFKLLDAGATRIGCSSSVEIMKEFHKLNIE